MLAEADPVSAAVLPFAHGATGIQLAFRVHRPTRQSEGSHEERKLISEIRDRIEIVDSNDAEAMVKGLYEQCHPENMWIRTTSSAPIP